MSALKKHYKLLIAIALFIPFLAFVDKVFFAYMEPKAAEAVKNGEYAQMLYGAKCAMCHGTKGEGMANFPKITGLTKEIAVEKIETHKAGVYGESIQLRVNLSSLDEKEREALAVYVSGLK